MTKSTCTFSCTKAYALKAHCRLYIDLFVSLCPLHPFQLCPITLIVYIVIIYQTSVVFIEII